MIVGCIGKLLVESVDDGDVITLEVCEATIDAGIDYGC